MGDTSLKRKRGGLKSSLTCFVKFLQEFKDQKDALSSSQIINLQERLKRIKNVYIEFLEVQNELEIIVEQEELDEQYTERTKFEDMYYENISFAKNLLPKQEPLDQQSSQVSLSGHSNLDTTHSETGKIAVKLPDIPLPTFDGSFNRWLEFKDTFESLINKNSALSEIQKFHYLRGSLTGKASEVIKSAEFSASGYIVAWHALIDRYDNKKLLLHTHLKTIFSLEHVGKETSVKLRVLIDGVSKHLSLIKQLGHDTSNWDTLLIYILNSKLESKTAMDWEKMSLENNAPMLDDFIKFLKNQADILETIAFKGNSNLSTSGSHLKYKDDKPRVLLTGKLACYFCNAEHPIYSCSKFADLSTDAKIEFVKKKRLCINCLRSNHFGKKCKMGPCKKCKAWHNSILHTDKQDSESQQQVNREQVVSEYTTAAVSKQFTHNPSHVFLSTAKIGVYDKDGNILYARALLDCGSQSSFISSDFCKRLGIERIKTNLTVLGITNVESSIDSKCAVTIFSLHSNFQNTLDCFVLPSITSVSPISPSDVTAISIPNNIALADPDFGKAGQIDILIGANLFWVLLENKKMSCGKNQPFLQKTKLGWILAGMVGSPSNVSRCCFSNNFDLQKTLSRFWDVEENVIGTKPMSKEEIQCEKIFEDTTLRGPMGRFVVTLPLKQSAESLGNSRDQAKKRFYSLERKLSKNEQLRDYYVKFMQEYEDLNHMALVLETQEVPSEEYFMPHHGVFRESSITTKLRVVFDASAPSSNGLSLNNIEMVGPVLQDDLLSILLRFRKHSVVISADVAKMYRQVLIKPSQRTLQKIFWRSDPNDDLKVYTLNTVTYGHASASYLAIRCLVELANECSETNPEISNIIRHDFYVDDLLTGTNSIAHAQNICQEVSKVLKGGCFELRKWYSNKPEVIQGVDNKDISCGILEFAPDEKAKTLGLNWSCQNDFLVYNVEQPSHNFKTTKRNVLSVISKIFDPLGLLSPCTILAKMFIQSLWSEKVSWDEPLKPSLSRQWRRFHEDLFCLNTLKVGRQVLCENPLNIELHGFSDASEKGYGACIYLRSVSLSGNVDIDLVCAKSKVAPIKSLTIPKLELCAALLLSRLAQKIIQAMQLKLDRSIFWSDSSIVLAWLQTSPNLLKIFVGNRVAEIQTLTENSQWRFVPTQENSADLVSRGLFPKQLLASSQWWHGPSWLKLDPSCWFQINQKIENLPELKPVRVSSFSTSVTNKFSFERFSSFLHLQQVVAYVLRFNHNCKNPSNCITGTLSMNEMRLSTKCLVKIAQIQSFPEELHILHKQGNLNSKNKIGNLNPFLDNDNLIRVGGRLKHSDFPAEKKHPIILHSKHHLTRLLFEHMHKILLHPGPNLLLSSIREQYWPISGRNLARSVTKKCLRCFRFKAKGIEPIMGNLPRERTLLTSPFHFTGVDYAGPFLTKVNKRSAEKCYIGVFVCFTTKALHLELISSLSTQAFLQALRRFVSRRAGPQSYFLITALLLLGPVKN